MNSVQWFDEAIQHDMRLPRPGSGKTLERWRHLAALAAKDLAACKLAEAHWDAMSILEDLGVSESLIPNSDSRWAVWASENPQAPLQVEVTDHRAVLQGSKQWCSGAQDVTHALLTCHSAHGESYLAMLDMQSAGIHRQSHGWQALGMRHVSTATLTFEDTPVTLLGERSLYLQRPGFWHGGAGIAACWYGAACQIAQQLRLTLRPHQPHAAAHLGAMFTQLRAGKAMLEQLAQQIDAAPEAPWTEEVQAVRSWIRQMCSTIIERSARAMGPAPLCMNAEHAQRCADLSVWCTQQHAEKDDEALGLAAQALSIVWEL